MYFICGIHDIGKTTFAQKLSKEIRFKYYSVSELIKPEGIILNNNNKGIKSIEENQQKLLQAIKYIPSKQIILDSHLCFINNEGEIQRIDKNIFQQLEVDRLYIVIDKSINIYRQLKKCGHSIWDLQYIEKFQIQEIEYALELSKLLHVPLKIIYNNEKIISFAIISDHNILLPIKPIYANKILEKTKKYEYRKNICKKDIEKIYIYATSPVKKIVGEAKVIDKIVMEKEKLWNMSKENSGISFEFFSKYFDKQDYACAYHLGEIKQYEFPLELEKIGINYSPQSYIYIGNL